MNYQLGSIIIAILMIASTSGFLVWLALANRETRINVIKNYKKGWCLIFYVFAIPLFVFGYVFAGTNALDSFLLSINDTISMIALKFNVSFSLLGECFAFKFALYAGYFIAILNVLLFIISCVGQSFLELVHDRSTRNLNKFTTIYFGVGNTNQKIYAKRHRSDKENKKSNDLNKKKDANHRQLLVDAMTRAQANDLFIDKINYKRCSDSEHLEKWISKIITKLSKKVLDQKLDIIINFNDDKTNLDVSSFIIKKWGDIKKANLSKIDIYLFGKNQYRDIFKLYEKKCQGVFHYINEYEQTAFEFVDKYPLAKYFDSEIFDYETALVKPNVKLNVSMIGFGKTNSNIFLKMLATNQFARMGKDKKLHTHPVNYHFFDKQQMLDTMTMNHGYNRYKQFRAKAKQKDYLKFPDPICNDIQHKMDINDPNFYNELKSVLCQDNARNFIIIALGDEYLNIAISEKIIAKLSEWNVEKAHIFVHTKTNTARENAKHLVDGNICEYFGCQDDVLLNYDFIVHKQICNMGVILDTIYSQQKNASEKDENKRINLSDIDDIRAKARYQWSSKPTFNRESSITSCLAIRGKLNMLGLDYVDINDNQESISKQQYLDIYAKGFMPQYKRFTNGVDYVVYDSLNFKKSVRTTMAFIEHGRWLAFVISNGYIPVDLKFIDKYANKLDAYNKIKTKNRVNWCITDFDSLAILRKKMSKINKKSEMDNDTVIYDFHILDSIYELCEINKMKLVRMGR